jgi:hypothetical protein|tara:strand:- start:183 stop:389 length:207 start_codon:yes stop_codon:yes gene_type:complete
MTAFVHFIGVTQKQSLQATLVWGFPDFIHRWHDWRSHGDIDWDNDIVVFGDKGKLTPSKYSDQDHERH